MVVSGGGGLVGGGHLVIIGRSGSFGAIRGHSRALWVHRGDNGSSRVFAICQLLVRHLLRAAHTDVWMAQGDLMLRRAASTVQQKLVRQLPRRLAKPRVPEDRHGRAAAQRRDS